MRRVGVREERVPRGDRHLVRDCRTIVPVPSGISGGDYAGGGCNADSSSSEKNNSSATPSSMVKGTATAVARTNSWESVAVLEESGDDNNYILAKSHTYHPVYGGVFLSRQAFGAVEHATDNLEDTIRATSQKKTASRMPESSFKISPPNRELHRAIGECSTSTSIQFQRGKRWHPKAADSHVNMVKGKTTSLKTCSGESNEGEGSPKNDKPGHAQTARVECKKSRIHNALAFWSTGSVKPPNGHRRENLEGKLPKTRDTLSTATSRQGDVNELGRPHKDSGTRAVESGTSNIIENCDHISKNLDGLGGSLWSIDDRTILATDDQNEVLAHHPVHGVVPAFAPSCRLFADYCASSIAVADKTRNMPSLPGRLSIGSNVTTNPFAGDKGRQQDDQFLQATDDRPTARVLGGSPSTGAETPGCGPVKSTSCCRGPVRRKRKAELTHVPALDTSHALHVPLPEGLLEHGRAGSTT